MNANKMNARKAEKLEAMRKERVAALLANKADDGRIGRAKEIMRARPLSNKTDVSAQNRIDNYAKFETENGVRYVPCESKINGGRVGDLLDGSNKSRFVIYSLDFTQKHKATKTRGEWSEVRHIDDVIIPTELFCEALRHFGALKKINHHGVTDGIGIQPSNKRFYEWLKEYPVEYHREWVYMAEDFEGVGL